MGSEPTQVSSDKIGIWTGDKADDVMVERSSNVGYYHGEDGAPPYVVRWADGHESAVYPGPLARVLPASQQVDDPAR